MQLAHHGLELGHRLVGLRAVAWLLGEEGDGVVAPVVGQSQLLQSRFRHKGGHRHQLHRGDAETLDVLDDQRVTDAKVGALQRFGDPRVLLGKALDVGLVEDGAGRADPRLANPLPVKAVINHHRLGNHPGTVP